MPIYIFYMSMRVINAFSENNGHSVDDDWLICCVAAFWDECKSLLDCALKIDRYEWDLIDAFDCVNHDKLQFKIILQIGSDSVSSASILHE